MKNFWKLLILNISLVVIAVLTYSGGFLALRPTDPSLLRAGLSILIGLGLVAGLTVGNYRLLRDPDRVTLCCCWNGLPVFNAKLNFDYSPERLEMISGTLVFSKQTAEGTETPMDSATVLTRFVSLIKQEGLICSRIERLTPGYLMAVTLSGESVLTPVWYIATDTADFYINAMTGQEEKVEGA